MQVEWESKKTGAGETAHVIKHWPCKHKGPSSIPRTYVKNPGILVCAGNPRIEEEDTGASLKLTDQPPSLVSDFLLTEKLHLQQKTNKQKKNKVGGRG
jgi:hypothetical protein